ncbi:PAS domain S-box-containing protein [Stigmatella aurantiaca]|uniref:histidine kinase n=1 Tax=Stigmatella aurantiaca TaxID=41 RepID=A0A1H7H8X2_STIAU|nr:ATP-binding protein [Stigmatella aurantiaca]SEK46846.1 PAS domain S-box-containing protein [Stigmatella aurantiaca]
MSGHPLRVLLVENEEDDAELILEQLRKADFEPFWRRVDTAEDMRKELLEQSWDIILCDYVMPHFSGADALALLQETGLDVPFIIVSGRIGEEVAVHSLKMGAQDFFRKDRLRLLGTAVQRELREAGLRRESYRARVALQEAESERALLLDNIKDYAIFTMGPEGTLTSWNPGVERLKGYKAEEFIGQPFSMLFLPEDVVRGLPEEEMRQAVAQRRFEAEGWRRRKDGSRFWAEVALTPIFTANGELHGFTQVTRDSTERKRLLEELRAAIRLRDQFLAIASHELKTPLTSLKLQLQSMAPLAAEAARVTPKAEVLPRKLQVVSRQADRLSGLIDNLLDVSQITSERLALRRETLDLVELAREVSARFEDLQKTSHCSLNVTAPGPVLGSFDRLRMENVLTHLLSNAFKFGAGKPVDLSVESLEGSARLTIRDRGIGISQEDQARIFERFERAVPEKNYGGFGLGLWIVRQVVEAHGGRIEMHSQPGEGSAFVVSIPQR